MSLLVNPRDTLRLQLRLEGKDIVNGNMLRQVEVVPDEEYRHQGFAQRVVSAWAMRLISVGKVPFYSHKIQNIASTNLAKRLGLQPVFEEIVFTYV
jgi:predicted GNAT family acetyltransferase